MRLFEVWRYSRRDAISFTSICLSRSTNIYVFKVRCKFLSEVASPMLTSRRVKNLTPFFPNCVTNFKTHQSKLKTIFFLPTLLFFLSAPPPCRERERSLSERVRVYFKDRSSISFATQNTPFPLISEHKRYLERSPASSKTLWEWAANTIVSSLIFIELFSKFFNKVQKCLCIPFVNQSVCLSLCVYSSSRNYSSNNSKVLYLFRFGLAYFLAKIMRMGFAVRMRGHTKEFWCMMIYWGKIF